jgi:hypothetical protein
MWRPPRRLLAGCCGAAEAANILDEALALTRTSGYPNAEARLLRLYGELSTRKDEPDLARERLDRARAMCWAQ